MKIKVKTMDYGEVIKLPRPARQNPVKQNPILRKLIQIISGMDMKKVNFSVEKIKMEAWSGEPALILMNHSSFIDLEIAAHLICPNPFQIVCTTDGFIGKAGLMKALGCIPTQKFVTDLNLVKDMKYSLSTLKSSVLMYPEAGYSFDGRATAIPESLGKCVKMLKAPVIMIKTTGAFARDPLYNMLQLRKVDVSATMEYLLSPEEINKMSIDEINSLLKDAFTFDNFKWQQDNRIKIDEPFRADGLNRVLYKCPHCLTENKMTGKGINLTCHECGTIYELDEYGFLRCTNNETRFSHIPDWYSWERECVRDEIENNSYKMEQDVDIYMIVDRKYLYRVGEGTLSHSPEGFCLTGCDGRLEYRQKPSATYTLNSDYYWYEIGDMINIGDIKTSYFCFPKGTVDVVTKTRLATEEMYKLNKISHIRQAAN